MSKVDYVKRYNGKRVVVTNPTAICIPVEFTGKVGVLTSGRVSNDGLLTTFTIDFEPFEVDRDLKGWAMDTRRRYGKLIFRLAKKGEKNA